MSQKSQILELRNLGYMSCTQRIGELINKDGVPIIKGERTEYDHVKKKHHGVCVYTYSAIAQKEGHK